jgi:3D (Asp-Asp-Asp) domain-containing protein
MASAAMLAAFGLPWSWSASADSNRPIADDRISIRVVEEREPIACSTVQKHTTELRTGTTKTLRSGVAGLALVTYRVTVVDDRETAREVVSRKVLKEPVAEIVQVGRAQASRARGKLGSRGYYAGRRVVTMIATGYDPSPASNGGTNRTSTGLKVGHGVVAVDPRFIPIGTKLYIEGYGHAVAADVGGAIKGNRIDLGHDSARGARNIGRRVVRVHILD